MKVANCLSGVIGQDGVPAYRLNERSLPIEPRNLMAFIDAKSGEEKRKLVLALTRLLAVGKLTNSFPSGCYSW